MKKTIYLYGTEIDKQMQTHQFTAGVQSDNSVSKVWDPFSV